MAHFDAVLPGRVHRVIYETHGRRHGERSARLLDYCGLPFDERCLRFYENDRAVRTASSEQVRRPIYRDGVDHWQHYESWLEPLKAGARAGARILSTRFRRCLTDSSKGAAWTRGYNMGESKMAERRLHTQQPSAQSPNDRYRFHWPPRYP